MQLSLRAKLFAAILAAVFVPVGIAAAVLAYNYAGSAGQALGFLAGALALGAAVATLLWLAIGSLVLKPLSGIMRAASELELDGPDQDLETRVRQEAAELVEREKLEAMAEVSSGLAHEIRNPLSAILSGISLLESGRRTPAESEHIFKLIKREARRLNASLTDFLLFARPNEPLRVRIDLGGMIREVAQLIEDDPETKGEVNIRLEIEEMDSIWFDDDQLRQAIWNVALNAIQAMEGRGELTIRTGSDQEGFFRIEIEDTGPGVPEKLGERIFAPFFSTKKEGTGLGLSIVRRVVTSHGGTVTFENGAEQGTKFIIIAPVKKDRAPQSEETEQGH